MVDNAGKVPAHVTHRQPSSPIQIKCLRRLGFIKNSGGRSLSKCFRVGYWGDIPTPLENKNNWSQQNSPSVRADLGSAEAPAYNFTYAPDFELPPELSKIENLRYSPNGFAWDGRALDVSASAHPPRTLNGMLAEAPTKVDLWIEQATVIGTSRPMTYGDWIAEHVATLASTKDWPRPLVLPQFMRGRPYAINDLARLGIETFFPDHAIGVRNATVLHKRHMGTLLLQEDVTAIRHLFAIPESKPTKGSVIFLSRAGVTSANGRALRDYNSERTERIVADLGGLVCRTKHMSASDFAELATLADIVIADHGAAMFNVIYWSPKAMIELVTHDWWVNCFCFLSSACGVDYHGIIDLTKKSEDDLRRAILQHIVYSGVARSRGDVRCFSPETFLQVKRTIERSNL